MGRSIQMKSDLPGVQQKKPGRSCGFRHVTLFSLLALVFLFTACSFMTQFVVINKSDQPVRVTYRLRPSTSELTRVCEEPAVMTMNQFTGEDSPWQSVTASRVQVNRENRTITVLLNPEEVLLIHTIHRPRDQAAEEFLNRDFCADEMELAGAYGEIKLRGAQVPKGFAVLSENHRAITYRR